MRLELEPASGGDHRLTADGTTIVEQVKMRRSLRRWTPGEVGKKVLRDLLKAVKPGKPQRFRFVSDKDEGLASLYQFLAWQQRVRRADDRPPHLAWGRSRLTPEDYAARLAQHAGVEPGEAAFRTLIANLSIEVVNTREVKVDIERMIGPLLAPGQDAAAKRHEMTSRLLTDAEAGRTIDAADLLNLIDPQAHVRLGHARALPALLADGTGHDCAALGYDGQHEAKLLPFAPAASLSILSGESGQGKTWALCQSALAAIAAGRLSVVVASPRRIDQIVDHINKRVWRVAYQQNVPPDVMAARLAGALAFDGVWLDLYIDDVQSRDLAEEIARLDWRSLGIRITVSAQPRITRVFERLRRDCEIVPIENFTSSQLRRFLERHDRAAPLETMPDDVFELLTKPIHAQVFTELPPRTSWTGVTEYQLFKNYWDYSTTEARDQYDHRGDRDRLANLAGSLLGERPRYPWPRRDAEAAGLDDEAIRRLEQVGLIRWVHGDALTFASDRMLNWAVAEFLHRRIIDEQWSPAQIADTLDRLEGRDDILSRLGYVFLDLVWLLANGQYTSTIADVLLVRAQRLPHEWRGEGMWRHIATIGPDILPALTELAIRDYDEDRDWDIPRNIPIALAAIAESDHERVAEVIERLLTAESPTARRAAFRTARNHAFPEHLDGLWHQHLERDAAFRQHLATGAARDHFGKRSDRDMSSAAVKLAAGVDGRWLDARVDASEDPDELEQLLWVLTDRSCLPDERGEAVWTHHREKFLRHLPQESKALVNALGHFRDVGGRGWLAAVPLGSEERMSPRVLRSLARVDPESALVRIAARDEEYGWSASNWWLPELAATHPEGVATAILKSAGAAEDPLTEAVLYYRSHHDLIDEPTLDWVLDRFAEALADFNANADDGDVHDDRLGPLRHPLTFLAELVLPWQFGCLARRAGTALETELLRLATGRKGRTSRLRDSEGNACERLLAAIGGEGYDALVRSEIERDDEFGREDGYDAAQWSVDSQVSDALAASDEVDSDSYRSVLRMQALAAHSRDGELEAMVRQGAPIYVNAAEIRGSAGRSDTDLQSRIEALLATGRACDANVAAKLAGFLGDGADLGRLVNLFVAPDTPAAVRRSVVGTFRAHSFYDPAILPVASQMLEGDTGDDGQFLAVYLAEEGDAAARGAVTAWLQGQDAGNWFRARDRCLIPLLEHEDSRSAVIEYLQQSQRNGHAHIDMHYLRTLADAGDAQAQPRIVRAAYREPTFSFHGTGSAIEHLARSDPDEAFFAARRYFARHGAIDAIRLMLQIDMERAIPLLLERYRTGKPSVKAAIARQLRFHLPPERLKSIVDDIARENAIRDRILAAELAGWMPPAMAFTWLADYADTPNRELHDTVLAAIARRKREEGALAHMAAFAGSTKPQQWARLDAIFHSVDPHFLWWKGDPASLETLLDDVPHEFVVEARDLYQKRSKAAADEEKKADKNG